MKNVCILILSLLLAFLAVAPAEAKLSVASPQAMIEHTEVIISGKVLSREYGDQQRKVTLQVETVLKGEVTQQILCLEQEKDRMYGWLGFDFPVPKTKVMVFLRAVEPDKYALSFDLNDVAIIDNSNQVKMYNGHDINGVTQDTYAKIYQEFYQANSQTSLLPKKQVGNSSSSGIIWLGAPVLGVLVVGYILRNLFGFYKRN